MHHVCRCRDSARCADHLRCATRCTARMNVCRPPAVRRGSLFGVARSLARGCPPTLPRDFAVHPQRARRTHPSHSCYGLLSAPTPTVCNPRSATGGRSRRIQWGAPGRGAATLSGPERAGRCPTRPAGNPLFVPQRVMARCGARFFVSVWRCIHGRSGAQGGALQRHFWLSLPSSTEELFFTAPHQPGTVLYTYVARLRTPSPRSSLVLPAVFL